MNQENRHMDSNERAEHPDPYFRGATIPWAKSKEEVWKELEVQIMEEDRSPELVRRKLPGRQWLALAASLVLLLSVAGFMRFYTIKTYCPEGVHASRQLPDGSEVELKAATSLKYHPYWWFLSRKVELDGEAFFRVKEGKKFRVVSANAYTEVLGTTFNVFARGSNYRVTCHSGSVRVMDPATGNSVTLTPEEVSVLNPRGGFSVSRISGHRPEPGWTDNQIMFGSTPLRLVFEEIERQYGIVIETPELMQQMYSGNFSLDQSVENVLTLLCLPFDLTYERQTGNKYVVYPARE